MICYEILINGETFCKAVVSDEDQLEAVLVKLLGDTIPILTITAFVPSNISLSKFITLNSEIVEVGDEVLIRITEKEDDVEPHIERSNEQEIKDHEGCQMRCSFCQKCEHEVEQIIAGENVFICNECVELCSEIVNEKT